jgi:hypothetical protein
VSVTLGDDWPPPRPRRRHVFSDHPLEFASSLKSLDETGKLLEEASVDWPKEIRPKRWTLGHRREFLRGWIVCAQIAA